MVFQISATEIVGEFDGNWRPLADVQLLISGSCRTVKCQIDTACDVALLFRRLEDAQALGLVFDLRPGARRHDIELADGSEFHCVEARGTVFWFGERQVRVLAPKSGISPYVEHSEHLPKVLLGLELLKETELTLRFANSPGKVRIVPAEPLF